jgi:hypothetical protein
VRKTLTIDDDIAVLIKQEQRRTGDSFKGTVNRLLQQGLTSSFKPAAKDPFVVTPIPLGVGEMLDRHDGCVSALLEELEGPDWR